MKNLKFIPLFSFLFLSLTAVSQSKFDYSGISFTYPEGWKITEQDDLDGEGYYMAIEKEGMTSSGLVNINWVNKEIDPATVIEWVQEGMTETYVGVEPEFQMAHYGTFNDMQAVISEYSIVVMGIEFSGIIYVFNSHGKTITISKQGAVEDEPENKTGFESILSSFKS